MATTTSPSKVAVASRNAVRQGTEVQVSAPSRREFLYYIWGASMVLLLGTGTAGLIWFALPRFKEGEFGGIFKFDPADLPETATAPLQVPSGRFWISHTENGLLALYGVCTHLGCLPKWEPGNFRFACPCHGSQYELNGEWITGPAPRGLDRFPMTLTFGDGTIITTPEDGTELVLGEYTLDDLVDVAVDTGSKIRGPSYS